MIELYRPQPGTFNIWLKPQIYTDPTLAFGISSGGVVPNVNDLVITYLDGGGMFQERVTFVGTDDLSVMEPVIAVNADGTPVVVGADLGSAELLSLAKLYLNEKNNRFPVSVDLRIPITGADLKYAKLFAGTNITNTGKVVSIRYDESGAVIDDRLEVLPVDPSDETNLNFVIRDGNVNQLLKENSIVTLVVYNSTNGMARYRTLTVNYNSLVANLDNSALYIKDIMLEDTWIDPQDPNRILLPKNMLTSSFTPTVRKVYKNGSKVLVSLTDPNLTISGWGDFLQGEVGDTCDVVVKYKLKDGERSIVVDPVLGEHIAKKYQVVIVDKGVGTTYKIFTTVEYVDATQGFILKHYLYASDRSLRLDVTSLISATSFNGLSFGTKQTVNYSLDLNDVEQVPANDIVSGSITVELVGAPLALETTYRLYDTPTDPLVYGTSLRLTLLPGASNYGLDVTSGYTQQAEWLDRLYYRLNPLFDPLTVDEAPIPTHMDIKVGNVLKTIEVENWDMQENWPETLPTNGAKADVSFYILDNNNARLELACSTMYVEVA